MFRTSGTTGAILLRRKRRTKFLLKLPFRHCKAPDRPVILPACRGLFLVCFMKIIFSRPVKGWHHSISKSSGQQILERIPYMYRHHLFLSQKFRHSLCCFLIPEDTGASGIVLPFPYLPGCKANHMYPFFPQSPGSLHGSAVHPPLSHCKMSCAPYTFPPFCFCPTGLFSVYRTGRGPATGK